MPALTSRKTTLPSPSSNLSKMLGRIASAEKLEQQCRRARDPEGMFKAITLKIEEQARYIVLRDAMTVAARAFLVGGGIGKGTAGPGRGKRAAVGRVVFPKGDPGQDMADRWRKAFCIRNGAGTKIDFAKVRIALEDARLRCLRICEQQRLSTIRGTEATGEFERHTPARYIEMARTVMGTIDLDPASSEVAQKIVKATRFFTVRDDGLAQDWTAENVWLNPPYHRELAPRFIAKLIAELAAGRTKQAIALTNNSTDTEWFRTAAAACRAICFVSGRILFLKQDGQQLTPTQGQALFYFGADRERFCGEFCRIGFIATAFRFAPARARDGGRR